MGLPSLYCKIREKENYVIMYPDTIIPDTHQWRGEHSFICFYEFLRVAETELFEQYLW